MLNVSVCEYLTALAKRGIIGASKPFLFFIAQAIRMRESSRMRNGKELAAAVIERAIRGVIPICIKWFISLVKFIEEKKETETAAIEKERMKR